jgi:hypothetical protein
MGSEAGSLIGAIGIVICSIYLSKSVPKWEKAKEFNNDKLIFEYQKNIVDIEYPTDIYSVSNLVECHCGESCTSNLGICTRIYTTDSNGNKIMIKDNIESDDDCTFREYDCSTELQEREYAIINNIAFINNYIDIMNKNCTTNIYKKTINNNDVFFFNKITKNEKHHHTVVVVSSIFLAISILMLQVSSKPTDINNDSKPVAQLVFPQV